MRQLRIIFGLVLITWLFLLNGCGISGSGGVAGLSPSPGVATVPAMITFSINGSAGVITGNRIAVTLPFGTNVTNLLPTFTAYGTVTVGGTLQLSGQTPHNFTAPINYTVTTANGIIATYRVTVTVASSSAKAITAFSLGTSSSTSVTTGIITIFNIAVTVPFGTNLTSLIATFTTSGTSVTINGVPQINGVTANNYTNPVVYTVTAADGTTQNYIVTVTVAPSSANDFIAFSANGTLGVITASGLTQNIVITVPFGTSLTGLIAAFITTGESVVINGVTQVSGVTQNDFTGPVTYIVTAADGTIKTYTVTVTVAANSANSISAFSFGNISGVITGQNIAVTVPSGTNVTALIATFTTTGANVIINGIDQTSTMTPNDFTSPVVYTVTAADGTTQTYTVSVTVASASSKDITAFLFGTTAGVISGQAIAVTIPFATDITNLAATFSTTGARVSIGTVIQNSGSTTNDFTNPVIYTVTAADGTTQSYTVTVSVASISANAITAFSLGGTSGVISGTNIAVTVPSGTDVTNLIATFTTTGVSVTVGGITQVSGAASSAHDFSSPVIYTATAADGSQAAYTVTVTVAAASSKEITAFSLNGTAGVINGFNITVTVPLGNDVTALIATFTTTGVTVTVEGVTQTSGTAPTNNFTSPVIYTVTAADNSTATYTVTVTTMGQTGQLSFLPTTPTISAAQPGDVIMSPNGNFLYATSGANNVVTQYRIDTTTGQLNPLSPATIATGTDPFTIAITPNGKFAYVSNATLGNSISQYRLDSTNGQLSSLAPDINTSPATPNGITINSSGSFAYVAMNNLNKVFQYSIGTDGQLTQLPALTADTGLAPRRIAISSNGKFAYVSNATGNSISQYSVSPTNGQLIPFLPPNTTVPTGTTPFGINLSPNGKFAYVNNSGGGDISQYSVDATTGQLSPLSTIAAGTNPRKIAITPNGSFLYVTNNVGNSISEYHIDSVTGLLTQLPTPFITVPGPLGIAVSINGGFVYVGNTTTATISQFMVN